MRLRTLLLVAFLLPAALFADGIVTSRVATADDVLTELGIIVSKFSVDWNEPVCAVAKVIEKRNGEELELISSRLDDPKTHFEMKMVTRPGIISADGWRFMPGCPMDTVVPPQNRSVALSLSGTLGKNTHIMQGGPCDYQQRWQQLNASHGRLPIALNQEAVLWMDGENLLGLAESRGNKWDFNELRQDLQNGIFLTIRLFPAGAADVPAAKPPAVMPAGVEPGADVRRIGPVAP